VSDDQTARVLAALERLEAGQVRLEAGQTQHTAALERLETGQTKLRADLMARIDRLQDTVETIRGDITVNFGRADQVQRIASNLRDDLRALYGVVSGGRDELHALSEVVNGMERQVRRLQSEVQTLRDEDGSRMYSRGP
jgi:predicted  nucleic acid-binding Zn-ribbon protein